MPTAVTPAVAQPMFRLLPACPAPRKNGPPGTLAESDAQRQRQQETGLHKSPMRPWALTLVFAATALAAQAQSEIQGVAAPTGGPISKAISVPQARLAAADKDGVNFLPLRCKHAAMATSDSPAKTPCRTATAQRGRSSPLRAGIDNPNTMPSTSGGLRFCSRTKATSNSASAWPRSARFGGHRLDAASIALPKK